MKNNMTDHAVAFSILAFALGAIVAGCTPARHLQSVTNAPVAAPSPAPVPEPVVWHVAPEEQIPASPDQVVHDRIGTVTATLVYSPERQYTLVCPTWGALTIRLLPGEIYRDTISGNSLEWMIDALESSVDGLPTSVLAIRRGPYAPATVLSIVTDQNIYLVKLLPTGRGDNRGVRMVSFVDPQASARRQEQRGAATRQRRRTVQAPVYPTLDAATARHYQVHGDDVPWKPLQVEGDQRRTFIYLPAHTGSAHPTLTGIQDGAAQVLNYRTVPGHEQTGAVLIADQPLGNATLQGDDGQVFITGGQ